jgi:hypothetical protein
MRSNMPFAEISFKFRRNFGMPDAGHALLPEQPALESNCRHLQEDIMLKRSVFLVVGIAAVAAMSWSDPAVAMLATNGIKLGNGLNFANGQALSNTTALQAVRLALPDGTEVNFR